MRLKPRPAAPPAPGKPPHRHRHRHPAAGMKVARQGGGAAGTKIATRTRARVRVLYVCRNGMDLVVKNILQKGLTIPADASDNESCNVAQHHNEDEQS